MRGRVWGRNNLLLLAGLAIVGRDLDVVVRVLAALGDRTIEADLDVREPVVLARVVEIVRVAAAEQVRERAAEAGLDRERSEGVV